MIKSPKVDRRTTLKWVIAGVGLTPVLASCGEPAEAPSKQLLLGIPKSISGTPYGADPDMMDPKRTWELSMTEAQLVLVSALTDTVLPEAEDLPSGSAVEIPAFINEWVSSPYEKTQEDRERLFELFEWLEGQARSSGEASFAKLEADQQNALLDRIAWKGRIETGLEGYASAFDRFRNLAVSAYFASDVGAKWVGYIGNQPAMGDYEGPTQEALNHLKASLVPLGLKLPEGL